MVELILPQPFSAVVSTYSLAQARSESASLNTDTLGLDDPARIEGRNAPPCLWVDQRLVTTETPLDLAVRLCGQGGPEHPPLMRDRRSRPWGRKQWKHPNCGAASRDAGSKAPTGLSFLSIANDVEPSILCFTPHSC